MVDCWISDLQIKEEREKSLFLKQKEMKEKVETKDYIVCPRCKTNNFDDSDFWGCPRGSCEAEDKGTITITTKVVKNE